MNMDAVKVGRIPGIDDVVNGICSSLMMKKVQKNLLMNYSMEKPLKVLMFLKITI